MRMFLFLFLCLLPSLAEAQTERELFTAVLLAEAVSEGAPGMQGVANVVANRRDGGRQSFTRVLTKPKQFSCLNGVHPRDLVAKWRHDRFWSLADALAQSAIAGALPDITGGATHFHDALHGFTPWWARQLHFKTQIGNLLFYR